MASDIRRRIGPSGSHGGQRGEITALLAGVREGDDAAEDALFANVYEELRVLAHARLRSERRDLTLGTTSLVHEAYLKLLPLDGVDWQDRSHFFATAARAMRRVLIDRARTVRRAKRGGAVRPLRLDEAGARPIDPVGASADELIALDQALDRLDSMSERQRKVVELRFFAGLTLRETADVLGVGVNTVKRDWSSARLWLNRELAS
jgi:RNA polymerase sigma factor (TIGR02999 family)